MALGIVLTLLLLSLIALLTLVATTTLCWMLYAWRDNAGHVELTESSYPPAGQLSFSIIVPARHEELVLERTLRMLCASRHPAFEVVVVVADDDPSTRDAADRVAAAFPELVRVVVDASAAKSKPASLNTGLAACHGDIVGVFDAEDMVHPELLGVVEQRMIAEGLDALQAGVQLMNYWSSWFAVRNSLEYFFWFRSRLHFQASRRFVPLGGNTVFVKRNVLCELGGWDSACLAEDCDLGVRLSVLGARIGVSYDSELVTREEVPTSVAQFVRQRTRWSQGFFQVYRKRDWTKLPRLSQRAFACYVLLAPLIQAFAGIVVPISILAALAFKIPAGFALLTWLPTLPTLATFVVELIVFGEFCRTFGTQPRARDRIRLIVGTPAYQVLLGFAASRALWRELRGANSWEKTHHVGAHLVTLGSDVLSITDRVIVLPEASTEPVRSR